MTKRINSIVNKVLFKVIVINPNGLCFRNLGISTGGIY